jgi:Holliday junction resolvase RusA-like endonuclease
MQTYYIDINPVAKPRMVHSDKWKKRPATNSYWAFKDELKLKCNLLGLYVLPPEIGSLTFIIPMPDSWSKKKKNEYLYKPHMQRPDLDNCLKSLGDCLCKEDSHIWKVREMKKIWGILGQIQITC